MEQTAIVIPVEHIPTRHPRIGDIASLPKPRYKGHWALIASDVERSHAFYQALTGAQLISRPQPTCIASTWDHEHHRLFFGPPTLGLTGAAAENLSYTDIPPVGERIDLAGGAIKFRSPQALVKAVIRMRAIGYEPLEFIDRGSIVIVAYHDPDGIRVEIIAPVEGGTPASGETIDRQAFMQRFDRSS
jgi:catechol 2,3-dioxygenase-like lactoylglutathione lyase family enzyme